jgi:O-acetyl-ADP-ribose deacetylase (regulator of RNase III)
MLVGTQFTEEECWRNLYGEVCYPSQAIDGLVSEFGGPELRLALDAVPPVDASGRRCPVGHAVATPTFWELRELYDALVHAVPPFYPHREADPPTEAWSEQLEGTYRAAFDAARRFGFTTLAVPLLGAGSRGAPLEEAVRVAARSTIGWGAVSDGQAVATGGGAEAGGATLTVRFGVQDSTTAHALCAAMDEAMARDHKFEPAPPPPKTRWS